MFWWGFLAGACVASAIAMFIGYSLLIYSIWVGSNEICK